MDQNMTLQETLDNTVQRLNDTLPGNYTENCILEAYQDNDFGLHFPLWLDGLRVQLGLPSSPHLQHPPPVPAQAPVLNAPPAAPAPMAPLQSTPSPRHHAPTPEEHPICAICLDPLHQGDPALFTTVCYHRFHEPCLVGWLLVHYPPTCPYCRSSISGD